jgi:CP family cyanate transporter-like MFS transporter
MATFFGLQSLQFYSAFAWFAQIYRDAGIPAAEAGALLGVMAAMNIPLSLWLPTVTASMRNPSWLIACILMCYPVAYMGLMAAPVAGAWLWAVLIGVGASVFPVALTLIGLRARTSEGTAALSGFTQSAGYLLSAMGPFGIGLLYDATGQWTVPLLGLTILCVPQIITGVVVSRPGHIEDQLNTAG